MNPPPATLHPASGTQSDAPAERRARALDRVGAGLLVALPLAMWLANRSAPLVLGLAAIAFLAALQQRGERPALLGRLRRALASPIGLAIVAFLLWSLISLGWSHRPAQGLAMWGEFALPLACGLVIAASGGLRPGIRLSRALAIAIILASALIMIELASGLSQRAQLGIGRPYGFIFNRPVLTCVMLAAAALPALLERGRARRHDHALAILLVAVVGALTVAADSGAAALGFAILLAVWALALLAPRPALAAVALGFAATMALAPMLGLLANAALPPSLHRTLAKSHTSERVAIWLSFGEAIRARSIVGSGFGASAALDKHPVAANVSPGHREMLAVGHPHSAPMQAWVETGLIGAACLALAGLALLWRLRTLQARDLAPRLALFAATFGVASVAHGAWQGWWIAALAAGAVLLWTGLAGHRPHQPIKRRETSDE
jgi:O-antigen ligase